MGNLSCLIYKSVFSDDVPFYLPILHILNVLSFSLVLATFSIGPLTYKMGILIVFVLIFHCIFFTCYKFVILKFWKDHKANVTILVDTSWNWPHFFSSYYNLGDVSQDSMNKFLSHLIEKSLVELELSHCIEVGEVGLPVQLLPVGDQVLCCWNLQQICYSSHHSELSLSEEWGSPCTFYLPWFFFIWNRITAV